MVESYAEVGDMATQTEGEERRTVAEILERIRARLNEQVKSDYAVTHQVPSPRNSEQISISRLRVLLDKARSLQAQMGTVNPRPRGIFNDLIQIFKKALRRALDWYTRPMLRYEEATLRLLGEVIEVLEQDRSRLHSLESRVESLLGELADLDQRTLERLERLAHELTKREKERL